MKKFIKESIPYLIIIVVVLLIRTFIITPVRVTGASMSPTLKDGEIMLLYKLAKIERNDIVVVNSDSTDGYIIKRVIGMPGDTIEYKNNKLYINDKIKKDKFASGKTGDIPKTTLGKDEYFVMGDNREWSKDSRIIGSVKKSEIKGKTKIVIFPFTKIGVVK